jgi:ABC-2 type transport system permease protein
MRAAVISPVVVILITSAWDRLLRHDPVLLLILAASLVGAWLLIFFSMVLMGSLSFFVESALGIFELWLGIHAIFSGYLVPLEALPHWVRGAANVLPFRFMLGFPVETLVGLLGRREALHALAAQWGYVAFFGLAALGVWRVGLRRFSAYGG